MSPLRNFAVLENIMKHLGHEQAFVFSGGNCPPLEMFLEHGAVQVFRLKFPSLPLLIWGKYGEQWLLQLHRRNGAKPLICFLHQGPQCEDQMRNKQWLPPLSSPDQGDRGFGKCGEHFSTTHLLLVSGRSQDMGKYHHQQSLTVEDNCLP